MGYYLLTTKIRHMGTRPGRNPERLIGEAMGDQDHRATSATSYFEQWAEGLEWGDGKDVLVTSKGNQVKTNSSNHPVTSDSVSQGGEEQLTLF